MRRLWTLPGLAALVMAMGAAAFWPAALEAGAVASSAAGLAAPAAPISDPAASFSTLSTPEYALFRNVALGLGAVGFLTGAAGMALNRDNPEGYLQWRRVLLLCTVVFLLAALDRIVSSGITQMLRAGSLPLVAMANGPAMAPGSERVRR